MERQDPTEQRDLALLAHAVHQEAEYSGVPICVSVGCEHARQTGGGGIGRKVLET